MQKFALICCLFFFTSPLLAKSSTSQDLLGKWQAIGYFYQGSFVQPKDPRLLLTFEFFKDGTDTLFWKYKGQNDFCERRGHWKVKEGKLEDEVFWLHPQNGKDCGGDPDMQVGKINISPFWVEKDQLFVEIPLGQENLIYVWKKI